MNGKPRVSVVIPVLDGATYLPDALSSVLSQTFADFEAIVVDDGSTDGTGRVISDYASRDRRIVPLRQENLGLPAARNVGLQLARADVVAFLDADDVWLPEKLERQLAHLDQNPGCEACFTHAEQVDHALRVIAPWGDLREKYGFAVVGPELLVEHGNLIPGSGSSVMAQTSALREVGGFDERMVACEDLDLWYRLSRRAPLHAVPEVLVRIRRSPGQMQSDFSRVLLGRIQFLENVQQHGDECHRQLARGVEKRVRMQLLRRSLRRGQLRRGGAQALGLVSRGRERELQ